MTCQVDFTPQALEDISSLDTVVARRISTKIEWLAENFDQLAPESLTGKFQGVYKLRVGDWRVLYTVDHNRSVMTIHVVAHRSKVYKE